MRRKNIWKPDFDVIAELIQEYPGGIEAFILKLVKTKGQRERLIELLQQGGDKAKSLRERRGETRNEKKKHLETRL